MGDAIGIMEREVERGGAYQCREMRNINAGRECRVCFVKERRKDFLKEGMSDFKRVARSSKICVRSSKPIAKIN